MNDTRTMYAHGLLLKLHRGNLRFKDRSGREKTIHVGAWGDDLFDALEFAKERQEAEKSNRRGFESLAPSTSENTNDESSRPGTSTRPTGSVSHDHYGLQRSTT